VSATSRYSPTLPWLVPPETGAPTASRSPCTHIEVPKPPASKGGAAPLMVWSQDQTEPVRL